MRFYPRSPKSRDDALIGPDHVSLHSPRNDQSRRDALARYTGANPALIPTVAVTGTAAGAACTESSLVAGGSTIIWTITGDDRFHTDLPTNTNIFSTFISGLVVTSTAPRQVIAAVVSGSNLALTSFNKVLTLTLPAVAAYSINVSDNYAWTLDRTLFRNGWQNFVVTSCVVVSANA